MKTEVIHRNFLQAFLSGDKEAITPDKLELRRLSDEWDASRSTDTYQLNVINKRGDLIVTICEGVLDEGGVWVIGDIDRAFNLTLEAN